MQMHNAYLQILQSRYAFCLHDIISTELQPPTITHYGGFLRYFPQHHVVYIGILDKKIHYAKF